MEESIVSELIAATNGNCKSVAEIAELSGAIALDMNDRLSGFRKEFCLPLCEDVETEATDTASVRKQSSPQSAVDRRKRCDGGVRPSAVYLCGHSLGLLPKRTRELVSVHLDLWAQLGVRAHFEGTQPWYSYEEEPIRAGGADIVGALPHEVVYMNSLTVNLHLMMVAFYRPTTQRYRVIIEKDSFPSDRCVVLSQVIHHGFDPSTAIIEIGSKSDDGSLIDFENLRSLIIQHSEDVALVLLPGVHYLTGQLLPMRELVRVVREASSEMRIGFDLAHAVGNVILRLHEWAPDFACWCSYKYLNGGPGAVAGCFVSEKHALTTDISALPRFCGWWGLERAHRFETPRLLTLTSGASSFQLSNPPILSLVPVVASLEIFRAAGGMEVIQQKSVLLTGYLELLLERNIGEVVEFITPREPNNRGSQLSLRLKIAVRASRVCEKLAQRGFICDSREPNILRVAPAPLYNSFEDVYSFARALSHVLRLDIGSPDGV
ncbi:hypothetical protein CCYA_CCYA06G1742 [Cyanidiococcus yangmingshanensis]|nr:hypothetical protein CCYA_CCYA06G1742 [Cyanidiococcus yangmingshanensis]